MKVIALTGIAGAIVLLGLFAVVPAQDLSEEQISKIKENLTEGYSLALQKKFDESNAKFRAALDLLPKRDGDVDVTRGRILYYLACNYAKQLDKRKCLKYLERSVDAGNWDYEFMQQDPTFGSLREEKEFKDLVERSRAGLPNALVGQKSIDGTKITKKDLEGKVVVIDVWGTWCPPCRKEIPEYIKLQEKYRKRGLQVIGLAWEKRPPDAAIERKVKTFAQRNKMNYPVVLISPDILQAIPNLRGFPTTFFVGRDGGVRSRMVGGKDFSSMENTVKPLLAQK